MQRISDSFKGVYIDVMRRVSGKENLSDALKKRNADMYRLLN